MLKLNMAMLFAIMLGMAGPAISQTDTETKSKSVQSSETKQEQKDKKSDCKHEAEEKKGEVVEDIVFPCG